MLTRPVEKEKVRRIGELIGLGEYPPAILVCRAGGRYLLLDGNNRHAAWKQALAGHDIEMLVNLEDCSNDKERFVATVEPNIKNGDNYTIGQIGALYTRLTKEAGFSKSEARKLLRLTEEHAEKFEMIRMEATSAADQEESVEVERAASAKSPEQPERAGGSKLPEHGERAVHVESPEQPERAGRCEPPSTVERANVGESPRTFERASSAESPTAGERAGRLAVNLKPPNLRGEDI